MKKLMIYLAACAVVNIFVFSLIHCVVAEERLAAEKEAKLRAERESIVNIWRVSR